MTEQAIAVNRDFKGIWIPREIWLDPRILPNEKILWAEIHSLYNRQKGGCYASNDYLCKFMGVKERRLQEMISNLKACGLVVQVSFDGRERVIKAILPPEDFEACGAEVHYTAPLGCSKVHLSGAEERTPPIYIENKEDNKDYISPPIPPQDDAASPHAAKAAEERIDSSKSKKSKISPDFSEEVRDLAKRMVTALHEANPDWLIPKNLHHIMTQIHEMITVEKRDPKRIFDVFMWTVGDSFWMDKLCKPNPAKYLRQQFGQLAGKMDAKPAPKERKFAASSNDKAAIEKMEEMKKRAL